MTRLADIPVRMELEAPREGLGGGIQAILSELASAMERLFREDVCTTIDLRSLPLSPSDRLELHNILGEGEIKATLNAQGESTLRETGFSGIWWVEHRGGEGELVADLLEVTRIPAILSSAPDEVIAAAERLRLSIRPMNFMAARASRECR